MKQTAVEWFIEQLTKNPLPQSKDEFIDGDFVDIINRAKEKEKEQLCKMYVQGRNDNHLDYYPEKHAKETYNEMFKGD